MNKSEIISYSGNALTFSGLIFLILIYLHRTLLTPAQIILISVVSVLFSTLIPLLYILFFIKEKRKIHLDYNFPKENTESNLL